LSSSSSSLRLLSFIHENSSLDHVRGLLLLLRLLRSLGTTRCQRGGHSGGNARARRVSRARPPLIVDNIEAKKNRMHARHIAASRPPPRAPPRGVVGSCHRDEHLVHLQYPSRFIRNSLAVDEKLQPDVIATRYVVSESSLQMYVPLRLWWK
jgi:hypothetical protein